MKIWTATILIETPDDGTIEAELTVEAKTTKSAAKHMLSLLHQFKTWTVEDLEGYLEEPDE